MTARANTTIKHAFSIDPSNTRLQKFWSFLQSSKRTFPMKEFLLFIFGLIAGILLASLM